MGKAPKGKEKEAARRKKRRLEKRMRERQQQHDCTYDDQDEGEPMSNLGTTAQGMPPFPTV